MPDIRLSSGFCNDCDRNVLSVAEGPKHTVWLLISLATVGLGFIAWFVVASKPMVWRCARCGTQRRSDR